METCLKSHSGVCSEPQMLTVPRHPTLCLLSHDQCGPRSPQTHAPHPWSGILIPASEFLKALMVRRPGADHQLISYVGASWLAPLLCWLPALPDSSPDLSGCDSWSIPGPPDSSLCSSLTPSFQSLINSCPGPWKLIPQPLPHNYQKLAFPHRDASFVRVWLIVFTICQAYHGGDSKFLDPNPPSRGTETKSKPSEFSHPTPRLSQHMVEFRRLLN